MPDYTYLCIDLKSFYASVECVERGLDPLTTNLVVADPERTDKTICLAVSPSMKKLGVKNRCRVFEIPKNISYIMAVPRMQKYIDYAAEIYKIYLEFLAPADIFVYSIDESFLDITQYLKHYQKSGHEMAAMFMQEIQDRLGLRATAGIGPNLYLTKIALDLIAKHAIDFIGELTEESYKDLLWDHRPLSDFWRIGPGIEKRLMQNGIQTMRELASAPPDWIYKLFGIDAELLIDHAWGKESVTMADLKAYKPRVHALNVGQTLTRPYAYEEMKVIIKEMVDELCLGMVKKCAATRHISLYIGYEGQDLRHGESGSISFLEPVNGDWQIAKEVLKLYENIVDSSQKIRRILLNAGALQPAGEVRQFSLFEDNELKEQQDKNRRLQETVISIQSRYGKDAISRGIDFLEEAMTRKRNHQIGGHKSGV